MDTWQKIIKLDSVKSTNSYTADHLKKSQEPEGTIILSLNQTEGRGIGENSWESEKGKNILLSLILYPSFLPVENQFLISKAVSLGIENYVLSKATEIKIKWPNDIYYQNKKLAGILIENSIKGSIIEKSIVGIGFNLNQEKFISDAPNPVSLKQITNKTYSIDQEVVKLRSCIRFFYDKLKVGKLEKVNADYLKCLYRYNEFHPFKLKNKTFIGKITGVNEFGHLLVTHDSGEKKEYDLKEIEFVI